MKIYISGRKKVVFEHVSRKQAFLVHLIVSLLIFFVLLYFIAFEWFPSFYYFFDNGYVGTAMIFFVDVILGPGLTFMVFKPGKKSLKFDMTVIIVLQILALSWGVKSVYEERPALTVFYYGKMLLLSQSDVENVDMESIKNGASGSQRLAFLRTPDGIVERRKFVFEALANQSSEIYYYGKKIEPVGISNIQRITEYKLNLEDVEKENPAGLEVLRKYISAHAGYQKEYFFYPIRGRFNGGIAVFNSKEVRIVDVLDVRTRVVAKFPVLNTENM